MYLKCVRRRKEAFNSRPLSVKDEFLKADTLVAAPVLSMGQIMEMSILVYYIGILILGR
jgi:hypothetical protein